MLRLIFEAGDGRACLENLINLCAECLGQIAEFEVAGMAFSAAEIFAGHFVGMKNGQVAADDDAGAAEFAEDAGHHFVIAGQLAVEPNVLNSKAKLLKETENQFQLRINKGFAGNSPVEDSYTHDI